MRTVKLTQPDAWRQMPPTGALRPWITDRGSLTARIVAHFPDFNLQRLGQHRATPNEDERRALGLRHSEGAIIREVLLKSGNAVLVFAHTAVHPRDLYGAWRGLSRLGSRPLAEMLFHDPTVTRMAMEYKRLPAQHALMRRLNALHLHDGDAARDIWARRSVFLKSAKPLLVTEVFLPSILVIPAEAGIQSLHSVD
jgi:chorismate lyase